MVKRKSPEHSSNGQQETSQELVEANSRLIVLTAKCGQLKTLQVLLDKPAFVNAINHRDWDNKGRTALHVAALNGHLEIVELLLQYGVQADALDVELRTPLHLACEYGCESVAKYLLDKYTASSLDIWSKSTDEWKLLMLAARYCSIDVFQKFLALAQDDQISAQGPGGCTLLHYAAASGCADNVRALLRLNVSTDVKTSDLCNPLMYLAKSPSSYARRVFGSKHLAVIQHLVKEGFDVCCCDIKGNYILHLVISAEGAMAGIGALERFKNFADIKGVSLSCRDASGRTPLLALAAQIERAIQYQTLDQRIKISEALKYLIEKGSDLNAQDNQGRTILHIMCSTSSSAYISAGGMVVLEEMIKYVIGHNVSITVQDIEGMTPLDAAIKSQAPNPNILKLLLSKSKELNVQDRLGRTPLHRIILGRPKEGLASLVSQVIADSGGLDIRDHRDRTILMTAIIKNRQYSVIKAILDNVPRTSLARHAYQGRDVLSQYLREQLDSDIIKLVLSKSNAIDERNRTDDGSTPLHLACSYPLPDVTSKIVLLSKDVNKLDYLGYAPIPVHYAVALDNIPMIMELGRARVNLKGRVTGKGAVFEEHDGLTPLLVLFAHNSRGKAAFEVLLDLGVDINAKDILSWGLVHFGSLGGREELQMLMDMPSINFTERCIGDSQYDKVGGVTALHIAASEGSREGIEILLDSGYFPDIDILTDDGMSYPAPYSLYIVPPLPRNELSYTNTYLCT
jgi:ankyrin repeat protein